MTTIATAVRKITQVTGLPEARVAYTARYLREAGLLPKGRRGGGKGSVHLHSNHLAALSLGLLATTTATQSPEVVGLYGSFIPNRVEGNMNQIVAAPLRRFITERAGASRVMSGETKLLFMPRTPLVEVIAAIIEAERNSDFHPSLIKLTVLHYAEVASIETLTQGGQKWTQWFGPSAGGELDTIHARRPGPHPVLLTATIESGFFITLADIASDSYEVEVKRTASGNRKQKG